MATHDYLASDVHLGAVPSGTETRFLAFLEHVGEHGGALLLAGDLFDFWFEYGEIIHGRHFRVLAALARLVEAGIPVTLAGGNHDAWGGRFLREHVGVTFHSEPFEMELGGRRALVAHGDGLGRGDLKYRVLRSVIRSRVAIGAFRALHPELGLRLARAVSSTDEKAVAEAGTTYPAQFVDQWAAARLAERPDLDLVVCGHSHMPVIREHGTGRYYLNAGDWITHFSYITLAPDSPPALRRWAQAARP
jgi:UDP-2,3-diacylglucosamine hydrolase